MADVAGKVPSPNNNNNKISKKDEEEFVVVNPHQYVIVDPTVKHNENQNSAPTFTPLDNTPSRPQSTMLDDAFSRQGTVNIGYPKGEFDEDDAPPPQDPYQDVPPAEENYNAQSSNGGNIQRENTMNIGYPKGEFDSDSDDDGNGALNDYENYDPTTSLQRI